MRPKAQHANRTFMLGTIVLGTLVIGIVVLFTSLSVNLSTSKDEAAPIVRDNYHFRLSKSLYGNNIDIYFNDSLLYRGTPNSDTLLTVGRTADDNAIIMVDRATDYMYIAEVPTKQGTFRIEPHTDGITLIAE